jgi:uncharacterized protein
LKVTLAKAFPLPAPADATWGLLQQVERVAGCMPGATITQRVDDRHYKGTVALKFGPASLTFRGEVEILELEPASRTLRLIGKGTDTTGGSGASMDLTARVEPLDTTSSTLVGHSEVALNGKAATFGGRMAESIAEQVLNQFAANFTVELQSRQASAASAAAPGASSASRELNALALLWAVLCGWLRSLFGGRRAA